MNKRGRGDNTERTPATEEKSEGVYFVIKLFAARIKWIQIRVLAWLIFIRERACMLPIC